MFSIPGVITIYNNIQKNIEGISNLETEEIDTEDPSCNGWSKMLSFNSQEAFNLNSDIFKFIKEKSYKASKDLADIFGEPEKKKFNDQNINILGPINNAEKLRLIYSASDLLLNPSRLESFGQIALESLSCGLPVMCRDGTGTTDLISSSN